MKKLFLLLAALFCLNTLNAFNYEKDSEVIFKAMQDELDRSLKELKVKSMPRPYHIAYQVYFDDTLAIESLMGEISWISSSKDELDIDVIMRVGNKKTDNSFFENTVSSFAQDQIPSLSYEALRKALWLKTDKAYKAALDQYTKKTAYLKKKKIIQETPDFSDAEISTDVKEIKLEPMDKEYLISLMKELSAVGNLKELKEFSSYVFAYQRPTFFLSSEGAKYTRDNSGIHIRLSAKADTKEGFPLYAKKDFNYKNFSELPSKEEFLKIAQEFAQEIKTAALSPKGKAYVGPILVEDDAVLNLFYETFAKNSFNTKKTLSLLKEKDDTKGELTEKKGLKVISSDFDVIDDPTAASFNGTILDGNYSVDDEGVKAEKIQMVKNGKLVDLPYTRSSEKTNGHARYSLRISDSLHPKAAPSNLFFLPKTVLSKEALKERFLQECKKEGLNYCYIIRRIDPNALLAYKVNAETGEEILEHGFEKPVFSLRTLRDIVAASEDLQVFNYSHDLIPISLTAPSVIIGEFELTPSQIENEKPPRLEKPQEDL